MQLSDYSRILKGWYWLIIAGAVLGLVIGLGMEYKNKIIPGATEYQGTERVTINCIAPSCAYLAGMSISTVANELAGRIHDPGILQISPRLPAPAISSMSANVNGNTDEVVINVTAATKGAVQTALKRAGAYLKNVQANQVHSEGKGEIRHWRKQEKLALANWVHFTKLLNVLPASASPGTHAWLGARETIWQTNYKTDLDNIQGIEYPGVPIASPSSPSPITAVSSKPASTIKTVFPAAIVGLLLSFALAAYLDSRNRGTFALSSTNASPRIASDAQPMSFAATPLVAAEGHPSGTAAIATVPAAPVDEPQLVPAGATDRTETLYSLAEPMNQTADLVSNLLTSSQPSLFVTSPTDAEPKMATAIGLASALTLRGRRVVLIDADPSGSLTHFFGLSGRPGLSDFLGYPLGSLSQLTYTTGLLVRDGRLSVLPYGIRSSQPVGLIPEHENDPLSAWSYGLADLARNADVIIVNGPSVLDAPNHIDPAAATGGTIVVLQEERAGDDVTRACDILRDHGARVFGMVVNPGASALNGHSHDPGHISSLETIGATATSDLS